MTTDADKKLESATMHVHAALKDLNIILIRQVDGWDEFKESFRASTLPNWHRTLLDLHNAMDK